MNPDRYLGRQIDFDKSYGFQCFDLANQYSVDIGGRNFTGLNASDIFGQQSNKYDWIRNTPKGVPPAGAIVVWAGGINNGPGHVAIATGEGDTNTFVSIDQNWGADRVTKVRHNYNHVIGWGVPKGVTNMATYTEEKVNRGDITNIYREGILRDPNANDFAAWDGKGWKQFTYDLVGRGDFVKKRFEAADSSFKQVHAQLQESEKIRVEQDKTIVELRKLLENAQNGSGGLSEADRAVLNENNSLLKQIWSKITNVFK